jgi:hypothetical protein
MRNISASGGVFAARRRPERLTYGFRSQIPTHSLPEARGRGKGFLAGRAAGAMGFNSLLHLT